MDSHLSSHLWRPYRPHPINSDQHPVNKEESQQRFPWCFIRKPVAGPPRPLTYTNGLHIDRQLVNKTKQNKD